MDNKGSTTWTISEPEIEITYYNNLNLNLNEILYKHNEITRKVGLRDVGAFVMRKCKPPNWINNFFDQVKFEAIPNCIKLAFFKIYLVRTS